MRKRPISNHELFTPPSGAMNSPAYEVAGGRTIYLSGMLARDRTGEIVGIGDAKAQAIQAFENVRSTLAAAGATLADVVKLTLYLCDRADANAVREVRLAYVHPPLPAVTLIIIDGLADPRALVEIEAIAVVDEKAEK